MTKKNFFTIAESLSFMESLKIKADRMPDLLGFKSADIAVNYKNLIQLSNSLAIVFLQYDLFDISLVSLKYASDADLKLHRYGSNSDKLWEGSMVTYNNLILLFHKVNHFKESLKLIYQAQSFMLNLKKSKSRLSPEIEICTNMLSFISLWRVGRVSESVTYLQSATDLLNEIIEGKAITKLSQNGLDNLFGIVASSLSAVKVVVEKNKPEALSILVKALNEVDKEAGCRGILENLLNFISENTVFKIPEDAHDDWLCADMFYKIIVSTCFIPLIDPKTPLIKAEELENAKIENRKKPKKNVFQQNSEIVEQLEAGGNVVQKKMNFEKIRKNLGDKEKGIVGNKKVVSGEGLSKAKIKPWWESKQFLGSFGNRRGNNSSSFMSEPRRAKRKEKVNQSLFLPKQNMNTPSIHKSSRLNSMLDTGQRQIFDEINANFKGINMDYYKKFNQESGFDY